MSNNDQWVITGRSRFDGFRYELSRAMTKEEAEQRLEREIASRSHIKYPSYTHLRIEKRLPTQLTFNFE